MLNNRLAAEEIATPSGIFLMRLSPLAILTHLIPECRVKKRWLIGLEWTRTLTSQKAMDALSGTYILRANQPSGYLVSLMPPLWLRQTRAELGVGRSMADAFSCRGAPFRLSRSAIQLCCIDQRRSRSPLETAPLRDRGYFPAALGIREKDMSMFMSCLVPLQDARKQFPAERESECRR